MKEKRGGDDMACKKATGELHIECGTAERDLNPRQESLKNLKVTDAELTHNARAHRLCNHGAMLEQYLSPDEFSDEQRDRIMTVWWYGRPRKSFTTAKR